MHFDLGDSRGITEIAQKLRRLPPEREPPIHWREFKRRQLLRRARLQAAQRRRFALTVAVGVAMVGAIVLWRNVPVEHTRAEWMPIGSLPIAHHRVPVAWDEAAARSRDSERWLATQPAEPVIVHVDTRAAVTDLEDRIAWVDDTLSSVRAKRGEADRARALQYERDRLINSLAQVRYAETLAAELP